MVVGASRLAHTAPLFRELKILKLKELYIYLVQLCMYKYHHSLLPDIFLSFFERNTMVHRHFIRQHNSLHVPFSRYYHTSKTVRIIGVRTYNHFEKILDMNCSYVTYKYLLKQYIIGNVMTGVL